MTEQDESVWDEILLTSAVGPLRSGGTQQQTQAQQQTQTAAAPPPQQSKALTQERLNQVQRMIEECLRVYMSAEDICEALRVQQDVDAAHTRAIYNSLKSASPEFFEVYELRLRVKEQIAAFNFVVAQQVVAAQEIPAIFLGTWKSPAGLMREAVSAALSSGLFAFDTANDYDNEKEIGEALASALKSGQVTREQLFIQSKLWNTNHRPEHVKPDLVATLKDLQLDYVDTFVIHWPQASPSNGQLSLCKDGSRAAHKSENTMFPLEDDGSYCNDLASHYVDTWRAMEALVDEGLAKTIGLSNFNRTQVAEILSICRIRPVVLQNESHPHLQEKDLRDFCRINNIVFQAYSPLLSADRPWLKTGSITSGPPPTGFELLDNPDILAIAAKHNKTAAQVVLRWHYQMGGSVAFKSVRAARIRENIAIFDFQLSADDMAAFANFNIGWRHLMWAETSGHPDYPFKEQLPAGFKMGKAPTNTGKSGNV